MFDTVMTIVGNVLTAPEWRRTNGTRTVVTNFKVASTSRRFDKDAGRWVDGPSLRVRVTCWRRLAENVAACLMTGDPVIVTGRMHTRDWVGEDGQHRVSYELEASAVGHDLARGQGTFARQRSTMSTAAVEDPDADEPGAGEGGADSGAAFGPAADADAGVRDGFAPGAAGYPADRPGDPEDSDGGSRETAQGELAGPPGGLGSAAGTERGGDPSPWGRPSRAPAVHGAGDVSVTAGTGGDGVLDDPIGLGAPDPLEPTPDPLGPTPDPLDPTPDGGPGKGRRRGRVAVAA